MPNNGDSHLSSRSAIATVGLPDTSRVAHRLLQALTDTVLTCLVLPAAETRRPLRGLRPLGRRRCTRKRVRGTSLASGRGCATAACSGGPQRPRTCSGRIARTGSLSNVLVAPAPALWPRFAPSSSSGRSRDQSLLDSVANRTQSTDGGATRRLGKGHGSVCRLTAAGTQQSCVPPGDGSSAFCCGPRCGAPRGGCATTGNATSQPSRRRRRRPPRQRRVPPTQCRRLRRRQPPPVTPSGAVFIRRGQGRGPEGARRPPRSTGPPAGVPSLTSSLERSPLRCVGGKRQGGLPRPLACGAVAPNNQAGDSALRARGRP